jgi:hypothetical protein
MQEMKRDKKRKKKRKKKDKENKKKKIPLTSRLADHLAS